MYRAGTYSSEYLSGYMHLFIARPYLLTGITLSRFWSIATHPIPRSMSLLAIAITQNNQRELNMNSTPYVITLHLSAEQTPHGQIWSLHFVAALRCVHVARLLLCYSLDSTAKCLTSHQAYLVVGNKGSCHAPTPAALHCCL
jgi:hypothetical protein